MRRSIRAALAVAVLLSIGPALAAPFTDSAGRTVELPDQVIRVFAAGPPAVPFLYTLAPEKMVGWVQRPPPAAMAFIGPAYRGLAESGRLTGRHASATSETVTAFCPDLVVDIGTVDRNYRETADRIQQASGVPYVLLRDTLETTGESYRTLGRLLGAGKRAEMLAARAERILEDVRSRRDARHGDARVRVLAVSGPDAGPVPLDRDLVAILGIEDGATSGAGGEPAIILAMDDAALAAARSNPAWRYGLATGTRRLVRAPGQPFGWLGHPPGPNRLLGLRWLSDLIAGEPPGAEQASFVRDFYRDFYGVELTGAQIGTLLGS